MTIEELENLLQHYGLSPNKTYGQNFLLDDMVLHEMVETAEISKQDTVLEVGPGIGNLTRILIESAGQVVSVEKDDQFLKILEEYKRDNQHFDYVQSDILKQNISELIKTENYKVVANIPYYATGKIIQYFVKAKVKPQTMTLLMQKEVAQNLTAKPGQLNLLAISVQLYADVKLIEIVIREKFYPAPKVDSAVVLIEFYNKPRYKLTDEKKFFQILRACFAGKRKQIHNTLENNLLLDKTLVTEILKKVKIAAETRPQQLSIDQWIELTNLILTFSKPST